MSNAFCLTLSGEQRPRITIMLSERVCNAPLRCSTVDLVDMISATRRPEESN